MKNEHRNHDLFHRMPFSVVFICGLAGVLVDIDHPLALLLFPEWGGRFLHTPLLIVSGFILLGLGTYLGGHVLRMVLKKVLKEII